jgi:hypothetical protein
VLSDRLFKAKNWFKTDISDSEQEVKTVSFSSELLLSLERNINSRSQIERQQAQYQTDVSTHQGFNPKKHVLPQWSANALLSKSGHEIKSVLNLLKIDVEARFFELKSAPRSFQIPLFEEFERYCEDFQKEKNLFHSFQDFWQHLHSDNSPFEVLLDEFKKNYFSKVAQVFLSKLRLLEVLSHESTAPIDDRHLLNPSLYFSFVFRKGSSTELKTKALGQNHYSWYRPNSGHAPRLRVVLQRFDDIEASEVFKIFSQETEGLSHRRDQQYSHALSHRAFGDFINSLLVSFPDWLNYQNEGIRDVPPEIPGTLPSTLTCKFVGDHLPALYQSFWLSMAENQLPSWRQVLCPDFRDDDLRKVSFLGLQLEMQFLCFLGSVARKQDYEISKFICQLSNSKENQVTKASPGHQTMMFGEDSQLESHGQYNRILLNIVHFPKRNPHHFLVQKIQSQLNFLRVGGTMVVISAKKLFVPSQRERTESLLKDLKVESCFTLKELNGKGEIGAYIYIFTRRNGLEVAKRSETSDGSRKAKEHCLSFIFSGQLTTLHDFSSIVLQLEKFYQNQSKSLPPLATHQFQEKLKFEFFQDAVVEGRLVNFAQKDQNKITHPSFYNNVLKSYVPIDRCFSIKPINPQMQHDERLGNSNQAPLASKSFTTRFREVGDYPYILIIDQRTPQKTKLELISSEIYPSKLEEYGRSFCSYFGLLPKIKDIAPILFREFFDSPVGEQLVDLTFSGSNTKLKGRLEGLLIPQFFIKQKEVPDFIRSSFSMVELSPKEIHQQDPDSFREQFETLENIVSGIQSHYPFYVVEGLAKLKSKIEYCLSYLEVDHNTAIFTSPLIKNKLASASSTPIFPQNPDVFIDFKLTSKSMLQYPLERVEIHHKSNKKHLSLSGHGEELLHLYSDEITLNFLKFLCQQLIGIECSKVIQGLRIPSSKAIQSIVSEHQYTKNTLIKIHQNCTEIIKIIFSTQFA